MEFDLPKDSKSIIKVIGVGGGGSNAVNHMYDQGIVGVDFIVCNTDRQALDISPVPYKIQLGPSLTEGLGAGAIPEVGMNAAIETIEEIEGLLNSNTKMVFVTAGLGGGTGTGAAPIIAKKAKELGILTVGIVTIPFGFEGPKRRRAAEEGLENLREHVDTILVINNERLREIYGNLTFSKAFAMADNVLATAAKGIAEVISVTGAINVDFNDVRTVMKNSGAAIMGSASAEGDNRAIDAVQEALLSPLLNDNNIAGAKYVLLNITYGDREVMMDEIMQITDYIQDEAGSTADVIWGHGYDATLGEKLSVTLIATGFNSNPLTGLEKSPEKSVSTLDLSANKEVVSPLSAPLHQNVFRGATEIETPMNEPFIKSPVVTENKVEEVSFQAPVVESFEAKVEEKVEEITFEVKSTELNFNLETTVTPVTEAPSFDTITRYTLEDEKKAESTESFKPRAVLSAEEQQMKTQERISKIQEINSVIKKSEGIAQFENEPAFVRKNLNLDFSTPSNESNVSGFGLFGSDDKTTLRNNGFLHDNVD
ncbi:MAG: cell division protein FtsZ [Bacteroidota bacterium]